MVRAQREVSLNKTVLDDFFYLFDLREEPTGDSGNLAAMACEQLGEGVFVAGQHGGYESIISRFV